MKNISPENAPLSLEKWDDRHIEELALIANNKNISGNMADRFPSPYKFDDAVAWIHEMKSHPHRHAWAIEFNGRLAGGISLVPRSGSLKHCSGIVYWLGEQYWGLGLATESVRRVLAFAFDVEQFVRVETTVFEWNLASIRVLEKCGFVREGTLRASFMKNGRIVDRHLYAALNTENKKRFET
ncbi:MULTISPECIES: GNAT family N-acetyltransferase [Herbaspirillum]|jgi:ribosomal-protein-alanine N-acetyltransferase|uniref:GNAT family N-acetyltransferase n=1 Tax=Herbaspirillum TaxID=963 RepID=UPI001AE883D7|nr:GNAT family protein [Herbaspirillum sp.]MCP3653506.1 GNAT family N-acetyltransferase [Herbaspirillum sp.]MCP3946917.1 GNAT family N-acetyltransferase [Herbaspirillum sp.]MCP4031394.1 GNAT family N-acetyltransferase [Herbaspirillum sp.]MCP4554539.1 GNAT family N-acetyltransferase [Herbaspirillum sp.]